jgi:hypothetical protein
MADFVDGLSDELMRILKDLQVGKESFGKLGAAAFGII